MSQYQNIWFINFCGIGNGVVIVPILQCLEKSFPQVSYYHTENQLLTDRWFVKQAGLENLRGFSLAAWRRFREGDWDAIASFIVKKKIDLIVNLRNEGPKHDSCYYQFKAMALKKKINVDFWDLDFRVIQQRVVQKNLTNDLIAMFRARGIDISCYNPKWLESISKDKWLRINIGFGMAASQINKRWPTSKWIALAKTVIKNYNQNIVLFPGKSEKERLEAVRVLEIIGTEKCKIIQGQSLQNVATQIGKLLCFVSNDTGLLHIAAAMNVPTIGLYLSTDAEIWSPYEKTNFFSCQNSFIKKCPDPKLYSGNCFHYYDVCPAIAQYGDDITSKNINEIISHII